MVEIVVDMVEIVVNWIWWYGGNRGEVEMMTEMLVGFRW